jgi:hypothetical protein
MTFPRAGRPQRRWIDAIAPERGTLGRCHGREEEGPCSCVSGATHWATRFTMVAMSFFSSITLSACSIVGIRSGTEEPRYTVLQSQGPLKSASMVHGSHSAAPMAPWSTARIVLPHGSAASL